MEPWWKEHRLPGLRAICLVVCLGVVTWSAPAQGQGLGSAAGHGVQRQAFLATCANHPGQVLVPMLALPSAVTLIGSIATMPQGSQGWSIASITAGGLHTVLQVAVIIVESTIENCTPHSAFQTVNYVLLAFHLAVLTTGIIGLVHARRKARQRRQPRQKSKARPEGWGPLPPEDPPTRSWTLLQTP